MNKLLVLIIIVISLIGCVSALDGNGIGMQPGEGTGYGTVSQYSQYYTMSTGPATGTHIIAPQQYQISGNVPASVYFNSQQQAVPYTQYQTYAAYTGGNSLWIQGATSWTQYAQVPQGSSLTLLATTSMGGNGYLYEIDPNGILSKNSFNFFQGNSQLGFWADTIGQHILIFVINGQVSNAIVIDVVSYQPPVYQQPVYQQPVYQQPVYQQPVYSQPSYVSPIYYNPIYQTELPNFFHNWPHGGNVSPTGHLSH